MKNWMLDIVMICLILMVLVGLLLVFACIAGSRLARYVDGYDRECEADFQEFIMKRRKGDF